ncbi:Glycoside hydrolase, catalytic domain protein [Kalmanozyma brasiliensis GHG001]|uniref:Likely protein kinase n=1 Tax=Kalmanozyma brasiliensis (strain GHG001) TaxID=1365824 RepID=V5EPS1_KALBG|nr:Glycoside hydrolase, catalytic domain protein [Kalmanozyma brasiliensis GHG001]EST07085.1 Glycoside hydrolase, catalytic domain protein [Kalmanozyma brasiliensis GHG001]
MPHLAMSLHPRAVSDPITLNGMPIGFIPDVGSDGGNVQTMVGINGLLAGRGQSYAYGFYDQTNYGTTYDGSKLLANAPDIYASGAILEASIMPVGSWGGYTRTDNSQATAVCRVMKRFTDAGVEVRLRFAHEVNYYVTTGEYAPGTDMGVSAFKTAWAQVSAACQSIAPAVKMWYCPNAANLTVYEKYLPDNFNSTVQMIGVDYYPPTTDAATASNYIQTVKPFHDKYSSSSVPFVIAEAGTHAQGADIQERIAWLQTLTSDQVKSSLPNLESVTWYNALRKTDILSNGVGGDFRILDPNNSTFPNNLAEDLFPTVQNAQASLSAVSVASQATATSKSAAPSSLPSSLRGSGSSSSAGTKKVSMGGLAVTALAALSALAYL